jgi:hypothetical protein
MHKYKNEVLIQTLNFLLLEMNMFLMLHDLVVYQSRLKNLKKKFLRKFVVIDIIVKRLVKLLL